MPPALSLNMFAPAMPAILTDSGLPSCTVVLLTVEQLISHAGGVHGPTAEILIQQADLGFQLSHMNMSL